MVVTLTAHSIGNKKTMLLADAIHPVLTTTSLFFPEKLLNP